MVFCHYWLAKRDETQAKGIGLNNRRLGWHWGGFRWWGNEWMRVERVFCLQDFILGMGRSSSDTLAGKSPQIAPARSSKQWGNVVFSKTWVRGGYFRIAEIDNWVVNERHRARYLCSLLRKPRARTDPLRPAHGWADRHQALLHPGCSHQGLKVFPLKHNEIYLHKKNVRKLELPPGFRLGILLVAHNWSRPPGVLGHLAGRQAGSVFQAWESVLSYLMVCTHLHHSHSLIHLLAYFKDSSSRGRQFSSWPRWLHALFKTQQLRCLWQCPSGQPSYCHIPSPSSESSLQLPCTPWSSDSTFHHPSPIVSRKRVGCFLQN